MIIHGDGSHLDKGDQARQAGNLKEALAHFKAHIERHPNDGFGWRLVGDVYRELDDFIAAEAAYTTAVGCPLEALPGYEQYQPHYQRGLLYQYMGKFRVALNDVVAAEGLVDVLELWGHRYYYSFFAQVDAELHEVLAKLQLALTAYKNYYRDHSTGQNAHLRALEVQKLERRLQQPQVFGALSWSGAVLLSELPDPAVPAPMLEALQSSTNAFCKAEPLVKLVAQLPTDARAWRYLGHAYWYDGRDAEAQAAFGRAIQLAPQAPETLFIQACLAYFSGNKSQAQMLFKEAETRGLPEYDHARLHQYRSHL